MTKGQFRRLALSFRGTVESAHMGHPDFRVGGRIFATLYPEGEHGMVKLTPDQQADFLELDRAGAWTPSAGAWGRSGCTAVRLAAADRAVVREAMAQAWSNLAEKRPVSRAKAPKPRRPHH
ncbi:MAG: MmcQ/YjbR family DNA-binding protein [Thermoanaerobaculia bacterium]